MSTLRKCERCGETYKVPPSKRLTSRFCSNECRYVQVEKICEFCRQIYNVILSQESRSRFCSKECKNSGHSLEMSGKQNSNWRDAISIFECEICGELLEKFNSQKPRFCSLKCKAVWTSANQRGENSPAWKGGITPERQAVHSSQEWKTAVNQVWKRDKATCRRCSKKAGQRGNGEFHVHHVVSFEVKELRLEPNNLVLLCRDCHLWIHSNKNINCLFIRGWEGT